MRRQEEEDAALLKLGPGALMHLSAGQCPLPSCLPAKRLLYWRRFFEHEGQMFDELRCGTHPGAQA